MDFRRTVGPCVPDAAPSFMVGFPGEMSLARAFIYAVTADNGDGPMTIKSFVAGANRMGLDVPFPTVTKRLANYGNPAGLTDAFAENIAKWNALSDKHNVLPDLYGHDQLQMQLSSTEEQKGMDF